MKTSRERLPKMARLSWLRAAAGVVGLTWLPLVLVLRKELLRRGGGGISGGLGRARMRREPAGRRLSGPTQWPKCRLRSPAWLSAVARAEAVPLRLPPAEARALHSAAGCRGRRGRREGGRARSAQPSPTQRDGSFLPRSPRSPRPGRVWVQVQSTSSRGCGPAPRLPSPLCPPPSSPRPIPGGWMSLPSSQSQLQPPQLPAPPSSCSASRRRAAASVEGWSSVWSGGASPLANCHCCCCCCRGRAAGSTVIAGMAIARVPAHEIAGDHGQGPPAGPYSPCRRLAAAAAVAPRPVCSLVGRGAAHAPAGGPAHNSTSAALRCTALTGRRDDRSPPPSITEYVHPYSVLRTP